MRTVIFDLDGTLADTSGDLIAAANACFRDLGLGDVLDAEQDAATAMRGGRAMLTLGFQRTGSHGAQEIDRQYPNLLRYYGEALDIHTVMFPGAVDAIGDLRANGYRVGVCTNKPEGLADPLLQSLGVRHLFQSLIGADTLATRKPDAAPYVAAVEQAGGEVSRSVLIGDTDTDRKTGLAAGVPVILVSFGPEGQGVHDLNPEGVLDDYSALMGEVQRLIG